MRIPFSAAARGSQKWLQVLVNDYPAQFAEAISTVTSGESVPPIEWLSPLREDAYAEYRDGAFLQRLDLEQHIEALKDFWPVRGPQWDGLGRDPQQRVYLVEAKAHVNELTSTCMARSPHSLQKIDRAFGQTRAWLNSTPQGDWKVGYYQQANRLTHVYFLREIASVDACLVNVYFINDGTLFPTSEKEWQRKLTFQREQLQVDGRPYHDYVRDVFLDVGELAT